MPIHPKLDPREEHHEPATPGGDGTLFLRRLQPTRPPVGMVFYIHGATFPSALSIAHRFDGVSWRDDLNRAGFDVWALDFLGFGQSGRYPGMARPAEAGPPLGRAGEAALQVEAALRLIVEHCGGRRVSLIAHSWGTMAAGRIAGRCPELVERIVFFGPIAQREGGEAAPAAPAWRTVTLDDQWSRFIADTPAGQAPVLLERHFQGWGEAYLDSDPESRGRQPPAVKVPAGPAWDIQEAWAGRLPYEPGRIEAPVAIIRGGWDSLCTDADAAWLLGALSAAPVKRDIKLDRGGHLMHLEEGRDRLYRATRDFLVAGGSNRSTANYSNLGIGPR